MDLQYIFQRYIHPIVTPDKEFLFEKSATLLNDFPHTMAITVVIFYLVLLRVLPRVVREKGFRKELKYVSALHNLLLVVLSVWIFCECASRLVRMSQLHGFLHMICDPDRILVSSPSLMLYATYLFLLSKFWELLDTVLLILKDPKRPVNFLHWYHHATVLLFSWYAPYYELSSMFHFATVNAFVHTIMYSYFFVAELGGRNIIPSFIALFITTIQILQMFAGLWINYIWISKWMAGEKCSCNSEWIVVASVLMYVSYLYLFSEFFVKRYLRKSPSGKKED